MKKTHLMLIDPQNDFCDKSGALFVPGADSDMARLAPFIKKQQRRLTEIHCTIDSHQSVHIAHPIFWVNSKGERPNPFTLITADDVRNGVWRAYNPQWQAHAQKYVDALAANKRYVLVIWPPHCLIGTWGHSVVPSVATELVNWEVETFNKVNFVTKGSNLFTEHYSGLQADYQMDNDPSTKLNVGLLKVLQDADEIILSGEALSHCVANTVTDIANNFGDDNIKKFVLLEDTCSNVPSFEQLGRDFILNMVKRGMKVTTTKDY